jgi:hypothetical protein
MAPFSPHTLHYMTISRTWVICLAFTWSLLPLSFSTPTIKMAEQETGSWARICRRLRSPGIDSKESVSPACQAWRAGATIKVVVPAHHARNRFLGSFKVYKYGLCVCCCWPMGKHCRLYFTFTTFSAKEPMLIVYTFPTYFSRKKKKKTLFCFVQGVTKRCLHWLTNSALAFEPKFGGGGGEGVCRISANEFSCAHGAQINFGDLTPNLTYGFVPSSCPAMKLLYLQFFQNGPHHLT